MKPIKLFMILLSLGIGMVSEAQEIRSACFEISDYHTGIQRVELEINDLLIALDGRGNLLSTRSLNRSQALKAEDLEFDTDGTPNRSRGIELDYYSNYDEHKAGKIKSINGIAVDYYSSFDIHDQPGTLKSLANISIKYYNTFDIHDQKGNLKSIGPVKIAWYNSMDIDSAKGRIKSIKGNTETISVQKQSGRGRR